MLSNPILTRYKSNKTNFTPKTHRNHSGKISLSLFQHYLNTFTFIPCRTQLLPLADSLSYCFLFQVWFQCSVSEFSSNIVIQCLLHQSCNLDQFCEKTSKIFQVQFNCCINLVDNDLEWFNSARKLLKILSMVQRGTGNDLRCFVEF